jgi:uncharacterized repeat protein (TIGR03803 family)
MVPTAVLPLLHWCRDPDGNFYGTTQGGGADGSGVVYKITAAGTLTVLFALLDALVERGSLIDYMENESLRKQVFAAAATIPCDKNDLGEALDLDQPKVGQKFIEWMSSHC